eukprot:10033398-Lingulodinium_polyedra.AAC.1
MPWMNKSGMALWPEVTSSNATWPAAPMASKKGSSTAMGLHSSLREKTTRTLTPDATAAATPYPPAPAPR